MINLLKYLTLAISLIVVMGCKEEKEDQNPPLIVATSADYPPFEYYSDTEIVGFEIDLIKAIAAELKRDVKIQDLSFDSILGALQSKRVDLSISGISATPEREKVVDFSIHYNSSRTVVVTSDPSIKEMADFKNKAIGVQMGSTYESCMRDWQTKITEMHIQSLTKVPDLIQSLKVGRIAGIALGLTEAKALVAEIKNLKMIDIPDTEVSYAIALPKGSLLTKEINLVIEKFKKDGTLESIQNKWFKEKVSH